MPTYTIFLGQLRRVGSDCSNWFAIEQEGLLFTGADQPFPIRRMAPVFLEPSSALPQIPAESHSRQVAVQAP